jgi:hypothetical protein
MYKFALRIAIAAIIAAAATMSWHMLHRHQRGYAHSNDGERALESRSTAAPREATDRQYRSRDPGYSGRCA